MADFRIPLSHSVGDEGKSFAASFASFDFVLYFLALGILLPDLLFLWSWTSIYNNFWHGLYTRIKIAPLIFLVMRCFFLALNGPKSPNFVLVSGFSRRWFGCIGFGWIFLLPLWLRQATIILVEIMRASESMI